MPSLTSEDVRQQAQAEGLTLLKADNKAGYFGVNHKTGRSKPYEAQVWRNGNPVYLGGFATAKEAALCIARSPEGQAAAKRPAAAPPLTSEEVRQQAEAEGLTLRMADNTTGYFGVHLKKPGQPKPYEAQVTRGGKSVHLGSFTTAEEAALCVARSPEGRAAPKRAASVMQPRRSEEERQGNAAATRSCAVLKEEGAVPPMPPDAFVKEEVVVPPMPPDAFVKEEVVVKREHEDVVGEGARSEGRPKRRRNA